MRKPKISLIGTGTISVFVIAGMLIFNTGTGSAATKPAPPPPRPAAPAPRPAAVPRPAATAPRPAATAPRPAVGTTPRPTVGTTPRPTVGTTPKPTVGTTPRPTVGTTPRPTVGTTPKPVVGTPTRSTGTTHSLAPNIHPDPRGNFKTAGGVQGKVNPRTGHITSLSRTETDGSHTVVHNSTTGIHHVENVGRDSFGHPVRTVSDGHRGFRERELSRRPGFRQRTYFDHGRVYTHVYHDRVYGRWGAYPVYVPAYYYPHAYYAWFGAPWRTRVVFGWGTYPGFAIYGGYFAPAPYYASPAVWMADYIIAENLKAAYLAQQDAAADAAAAGTAADIEAQTAPPAPIPQSIRTAYVQEVEDQVQAAQAQAAGQTVAEAVPGALSPNFRVFQSYSDVEATDSNGQECALTGGDFVRREDDTPDSTKTVTVTVVTVAKPSASHCVTNAQVRIAVDTLQDWYNSFAESQQAGFDAMASNQGKNGFPAAPDTARVTNPDGQGTPDDPNALASAIQQQRTSASSMQAAAAGGGQ